MRKTVKASIALITVLLVFGVAFATLPVFTNPVVVTDGCGDVNNGGHASQDIYRLSTQYRNGLIMTDMVICGLLDSKTHYAVHYDFDEPTALYNPQCETTSDITVTHIPGRVRHPTTGPGIVTVGGDDAFGYSILHFVVSIADFGLQEGVGVLVWGRAHKRNSSDRAPSTSGDDGCDKPQGEIEVLALSLTTNCFSPSGFFQDTSGFQEECLATAECSYLDICELVISPGPVAGIEFNGPPEVCFDCVSTATMCDECATLMSNLGCANICPVGDPD